MAALRIAKVVYEEIDTKHLAETVRRSGRQRKELSKAAGLNEQTVSKIILGRQKSLREDQFLALIDAMVGYGDFIGQPREVVLASARGEVFFLPSPIKNEVDSTDDDKGDSAIPGSPNTPVVSIAAKLRRAA